MKCITNTRDLFVKFSRTYPAISDIKADATCEFFREIAQFVGDVLHQNFAEIERGYFRETVYESVYETFEPSGFLDLLEIDDICNMIEELFYRIAPYVIDMSVGKGHGISGVGCSEFEGLDIVVSLEISNFNLR